MRPPAQTQVEHPGRVSIRRNTGHRQSGGPAHSVDNICRKAPAGAQNADVQQRRGPVHARNAHPIVADRADRPGNVRAVLG